MSWRKRFLVGLVFMGVILPGVVLAAGNNPQDLEAVRKAFADIQKKQKSSSTPPKIAPRKAVASGAVDRLSKGGSVLYYRPTSIAGRFSSNLSKVPSSFANGRKTDIESIWRRDSKLYDSSRAVLAELEASRDTAIQEAISTALGAMVTVEAVSIPAHLDESVKKQLAEMPLIPKRRLKLIVAVLDTYSIAHPGTFETGFLSPPKYNGVISLVYNTEIRLYDPASGELLDKTKLSFSSPDSNQLDAEWAYGYGLGKKDTDPRPEMMPALIQSAIPKIGALYRQVPWKDYLDAISEMAGKSR